MCAATAQKSQQLHYLGLTIPASHNSEHTKYASAVGKGDAAVRTTVPMRYHSTAQHSTAQHTVGARNRSNQLRWLIG